MEANLSRKIILKGTLELERSIARLHAVLDDFQQASVRIANPDQPPSCPQLAAAHLSNPAPGIVASTSDIPSYFDEIAYLYYNPDVAAAVTAGAFPSGYHHWLYHGREESRAGGPRYHQSDRSTFISQLDKRTYGVNLYGFLSTPSGLGQVARSCQAALTAAQCPLKAVDVPPWSRRDALRLPPPASKRYRINLLQQNPDMMPLFTKAYGEDLLRGSYNIGYWFWELPAARSDWHGLYEYVDEIWVASEFCRRSFATLTPLPVVRIPLVVEGLEAKIAYDRSHFGLPDGVFIFGYIFDVNSYVQRKNPLALVEAFRREFGDSPEVLLLLKCSHGGGPRNANADLLDHSIAGAANIRILDHDLTDTEIISMHQAMDCFVSPHRSEGFGLNLAEAMYLGKPVIATRYSGNVDFMDDGNSYLIDYKLIPLKETTGPYIKGSVWADPDIAHLRKLLRTVFEDSADRSRRAGAASETIRRQFSSKESARRMEERFRALGLDQPRVSRSVFRQHAGRQRSSFVAPSTPASVLEEIGRLPRKVLISVVTPVYNVDPEWLTRCIESVRSQWYPYWELCICDDASTDPDTQAVLEAYRGSDPRIRIIRNERNTGIAGASNAAAEISTGEYLAMLDNDDEITPDCLFEIAKAIHSSDADLLYTDEDKIEPDGSFSDHYFKPDFSLDHLRSVMYLLHILVVRKEAFYNVGGFRSEFTGSQDYDLALRLSEIAKSVAHIPKVLYHWRKIPGSAAATVDAKPAALENGRYALESHLARTGTNAYVEKGKLEGLFRVRYRLPAGLPASLLMIAGDGYAEVPGRGHIGLVAHTARSIAERTAYRDFELVIVADGPFSSQTLKELRDVPHRIVEYPKPAGPFNFARKVNYAVSQARHEHIVILNDDLEVISPEWLQAMLELSHQREIGIAGARLLFPDNRIQHVGMAIGVNGGATHVYHGFPADLVGYNAFTHLIRNYSAVTAACLATRREVFATVGGFDEQFAVDYNDVDFCLRVLDSGYRIVYTPYAELYHFEGSSLKRTEQSPSEVNLFSSRWSKYLQHDPHYNPNLTRSGVDFSVSADAGWPPPLATPAAQQLARKWSLAPAQTRRAGVYQGVK